MSPCNAPGISRPVGPGLGEIARPMPDKKKTQLVVYKPKAKQKPAAAPALRPSGPVRTMQSAAAAYGAELRSFQEIVKSPNAHRFKDAIRVRGVEWLGPVTIPANAVAGQTVRNDYVQPGALTSSRLALFGAMYEKFLFTKINMHYTPAVGSGQAGTILLAYDRDISDDTPPPSEVGIRQYMSWEDTVVGNVWSPHTLRSKLEAPETGFYTDEAAGGDDRLAYQGQLYVAVVNPLGNATPITIGNVAIEYEVDLFVPQLQTVIGTQNMFNGGSTTPSAADAFRGVALGAAGASSSGVGVPGWIPRLNSDQVLNSIRLGEGLYRLTTRALVSAAGAVSFNAPTCRLLEPALASSPQFLVKNMADEDATAVGNAAFRDDVISVPRGGGDIYQTANLVGSAGGSAVLVQRIGAYLPSLANIF